MKIALIRMQSINHLKFIKGINLLKAQKDYWTKIYNIKMNYQIRLRICISDLNEELKKEKYN